MVLQYFLGRSSNLKLYICSDLERNHVFYFDFFFFYFNLYLLPPFSGMLLNSKFYIIYCILDMDLPYLGAVIVQKTLQLGSKTI